jgi:acyl-coenzyme A thioesterase PaaI-like protein
MNSQLNSSEIGQLREPSPVRIQSSCFVCGQDNPRGLRIRFQRNERGEVSALWSPTPVWEGFEGIVHGGVVSAVLDEAMSKAVSSSGCEALTAELQVRFRRPVASGQSFLVRGWIVRRSKRLVRTESTLTDRDGVEHAHAWASFLSVR